MSTIPKKECPKCQLLIGSNALAKHLLAHDNPGFIPFCSKIRVNPELKKANRIAGREKFKVTMLERHGGAWSKGLTKHTDERLKNAGIKQSRSISVNGRKGVNHTAESKLKSSISAKLRWAKNPELHPWKSNAKFLSKPCERIKQHLSDKGVKFVPEWTPLSDRAYSIDIAFPDIKFGIEINGNQHYNSDGSLKQYYQERHDLICSAGWTLIEMHYTSAFDDSLIDKIYLDKIQPDYSEYFEVMRLKKANKIKKITLARGQKINEKFALKWEPFKEIVINSNIDFTKFGWVGKVAKLIGVRTQKVPGWMRKYMPDFYKTQCFKNKANKDVHLSKIM